MASLTLLAIPLEVRHQIFEYVASRDTQPGKILRYWFERMEVEQKRAELVSKNPAVAGVQVVYEGDGLEGEDGEEGGGEEDEEEDEDEEGEEENGEDMDEEDEEDEEGQAEEQDEEMADDDNTVAPAATASTVPAAVQGPNAAVTTSHQATTHGQQDAAGPVTVAGADGTFAAQSVTIAAHGASLSAPQPPSQHEAKGEHADAEMSDNSDENADAEDGAAEEEDVEMDDEEGNEETNGNEGADDSSDEDIDEENGDEEEDGETAAGAAQPQPAPVITTHRKWRHIPKVRKRGVVDEFEKAAYPEKFSGFTVLDGERFADRIRRPQFMRISRCPPPVELFLASKQLNAEAKNWFYDVAVLHIDATGSFAHTSFFEEAFSQITEAAFSPMGNIRKAEVTFVWDSTWLRTDQAECAAAIFPALLRQRAIFVNSILAQAPDLSEIVISWHDSAEDGEAVDLMNDVLMGFLDLNATVEVEPHYIAADAKPYRKSIAGKQRVEFQRIVSNGLDRLF